MLQIDTSAARRIILHLQGLTRQPNRRLSPDDLYQLIENLGFVQLDSIQWVERAHHMILFSRNQTYRPHHLSHLVEKEQRLFENWTHDASFIPARFYPYWRHKFAREHEKLTKKFTNWQGEGFTDHVKSLMTRISEDGALMSRDLDRPSGKQAMWQWHDGKAALEFLWRTGALSIKQRRNFQKVYDLPARCLKISDLDNTVSHEAFVDWACKSALNRLGFGSAGDIARFWDLITIDEVKDWLDNQIGQTTRLVQIAGVDKKIKELIARPDIDNIITDLPKMPERTRFLSPFDPVIRDRKRLEWLWNFKYHIEIYVPEAKRQWGYYVFPILEKERLIGRIDMKADRKSDKLIVRKLWFERGIRLSDTRKGRLQIELRRQARFAGVSTIDWDGCILQEG